jgi:monoterpene epsilon-lactone hydrolase
MSTEILEVRRRWAHLGTAADLAAMRGLFDQEGERLGMPPGVAVQRIVIASRPAEWLAPSAAGRAVVLYLHGGGYMTGSLTSYRHLAGEFAKRINGRALLLEYRLAPEHVFPAALEDAIAAYRRLLDEEGIAPDRIAFVGDSAGGNLVLTTLLTAREQGLPMPACAVCLSPWTDYEATGESMRTKASVDPVITREGALHGAQVYFSGSDPDRPPVAILDADLSGLPPLLVQVGSHETLLDDSIRLAARAGHHEVETTLEVWPGMPHVFQFFYPILREGRDAIARAAEFILRHTAR